MATVYDVPASNLIDSVSTDFKGKSDFTAPEWSVFVKTGCNRKKSPEQADWWFTRVASVFRKVYVDGPVGVERLRTYYGGRKNRGAMPSERRDSSGKIIRLAMQQLQKAGMVKAVPGGRTVTPAGQKYLDSVAKSVKIKLEKTNPALKKY